MHKDFCRRVYYFELFCISCVFSKSWHILLVCISLTMYLLCGFHQGEGHRLWYPGLYIYIILICLSHLSLSCFCCKFLLFINETKRDPPPPPQSIYCPVVPFSCSVIHRYFYRTFTSIQFHFICTQVSRYQNQRTRMKFIDIDMIERKRFESSSLNTILFSYLFVQRHWWSRRLHNINDIFSIPHNHHNNRFMYIYTLFMILLYFILWPWNLIVANTHWSWISKLNLNICLEMLCGFLVN